MHVEVRKSEDVVIADLSGRLVAGVGDEILREVVNELLAEGWRKILLNLSEVTIIDSAGVGELVSSLKLAHGFGASLKLVRVTKRVKESLHLASLLPVFDVYEDEGAALRDFQAQEDEDGERRVSRVPTQG